MEPVSYERFESSSGRVKYSHVLTISDLLALCEQVRGMSGPVSFDTETTCTAEHWTYARVSVASLWFPDTDSGVSVGLSHPDVPLYRHWRWALHQLCNAMLESKIELVGQNLKFDLRFVKALTGVDLTPRYAHDTMVSSHVLDENESAALKFRAQRDLGVDNWLDFDWKALEREQIKDPLYPCCPLLSERVPYYKLARYAMFDVYHTWNMHRYNMHQLGLDTRQRAILEIEAEHGDKWARHRVALADYYLNVSMPAARTLTKVEQSGLYVDRYWCEIRQRELAGMVEDTERRLESLSAEFGLEVPENWSTGSLAFQEWAEGMCDAGDLHVVARTGTGKPSWTKEVLGRLDRAGSQSAGLLVKRNKAIKEGAFLKDNLARTTRSNPRLYPTFHQASVLTGRLSSSQPNAQQQPKSAKNMFCAAPGRVLIAADFSQIELRLAAHIANSETMLEAYHNGLDLHTIMASQVSRKPQDQITELDRFRAKAANFGFLFLMGAEKFVDYAENSYGVEFTYEEAHEARAAFFRTWSGLKEWHRRQIAEAEEWGYVRSPLGRIRHAPDAKQAVNSPVQSFASDLMLMSTRRILSTYPQIEVHALVHDAIWASAPVKIGYSAATGIKHVMERLVLDDLTSMGVTLRVPLVADVQIGKSLGLMEKL